MKTVTQTRQWRTVLLLIPLLVPAECGGSKTKVRVPDGGEMSDTGSVGPSVDTSGSGGFAVGGAGAGGAFSDGQGGVAGSGGLAIDLGSAGGAGTGRGNGGAAGTGACLGSGGPTMARLPEGYCIDSTEVTRAQYVAWLVTNPTTAGQLPECAWNDSFVPDATCMGSENDPRYVCLNNCDKHPQVCVDWCDARAFCQAKGKRLCGKIGGGSTDFADYASVTSSQWYNACSSHGTYGTNGYPYGATYDPQACSGYDFWEQPYTRPPYRYQTLEVGSLSTCQSTVAGYDRVFDLSGNVAEWEDSCDANSGSGSAGGVFCHIRGGDFAKANSLLRCNSGTALPRQYVEAMVGFRCCSSP